ncbi:cation:proton antiporter [Fictibacillus fluitans]|uniref:Cation:proton antiporter n=1 Tax=Fictibacillus fluitans TaxID=3058422 RepID=A0ABT8HRD6_9BACL|nr:cation:proton antiporter [Fictibacillus sp. NE201]MDN4523323.1 cation:proton antiporter [Fictibacillus sp. NE201]
MFNEVFIQILTLLGISITVIGIAKFAGKPYPIALVLTGLILGLADIRFLDETKTFITQSHIFQAIIISLFLPILLGDAAIKLPYKDLKEERKPVALLAMGGTFLTFLVVGFASYWLLDMPVVAAFTFGALMSATDPISVISIFKSLGVSKRMVTIIEGESLFNDGVAVVFFQISSLYLLSFIDSGWIGLGQGIIMFLKFSIGGLLLGIILGYLFSQIIRLYDDYPLEIAFSTMLFFGSYFIAEHLHISGVIAVVVGGIIFGNYGARIGMSEITKTNINSFWDSITLIANSLIFLMIGLEIKNIDLTDMWKPIIVSIIIVIVSRTLAVYATLGFIKNIDQKAKLLLNWGGLRGSLSIALALSLPSSFPGKEEILALTFGVVLFSLLIQGLSIESLIKKLNRSSKQAVSKDKRL